MLPSNHIRVLFFCRDVEANQQDNFWHGCIGIVAVFSVISVLVCPNGEFSSTVLSF